MGKKAHPEGLRLSCNKREDKKTRSLWYASREEYVKYLHADLKTRVYITDTYKSAGISRVDIERTTKNAHVIIHCARPGVIIGKRGGDADSMRIKLSNMLQSSCHVTVKELKKPDLSAKLVAASVCQQLEKRAQFRKILKRTIQNTMRAGALGVKVAISGRIGGAEIARSEWSREGRVPLHTLKADIDYDVHEAMTTYGIIGVKVWIYLGDVEPVRADTSDAA